jgi:hypothetical protein
MGSALIIFSLVLEDADTLERLIDDRLTLWAEFESLRTTVDGFRDLPPQRRADIAPRIVFATEDLARRWRRTRPARDAVPRLSGTNPNWTLVLNEEVDQ